MTSYRKKPVVVEAWPVADLVKAASRNWAALPEPIRLAYERGEILFLASGLSVLTLEGHMVANPSDWIIRGLVGELYPCKPDVFHATYEAVSVGEGEV